MSGCWEQQSRPILALINTSPSSAPQASTGFGSCVIAVIHSTHSQQRHSSTHSCRHVLTTVTLFWRVAGKVTTDKFQGAVNTAARNHRHTQGLSQLLHTKLHWFDVSEWVTYKLCIMVHSCLHGQAPQYLVDLCLLVSDVTSRQHLRSASRRLLVLPQHRLRTYWLPSRTSLCALCFSSPVIFLLVDTCVGLNWLLVSFYHTLIKTSFIHSFIHTADRLSLLLARQPGTHCLTI